MAREFTVSVGGVTLANQAVTLIAIKPTTAANFNLEFLRWWVSQTGSTTSAQQRVQLGNTAVSGSPALTSTAPKALKAADPNASIITGGGTMAAGTSGTNATTESGTGGSSVLDDGFNVLNGWLHVPTPAETIVAPAGHANAFRLFLPAAPNTLSNWAFGTVFREV